MLEVDKVLAQFSDELSGLSIKSMADIKLYLITTIQLNNGVESMHGGKANFSLILNTQTDAEKDLLKAGVSRDLLNRMSGNLLEIED